MAAGYEIRLKAPTLDALKAARETVRTRIGSAKIGDRLQKLSAADADQLAKELLALLDAIDAVITKAKPVD